MFERFNEKAIKAIMLAQEEARRLGHNFVGTEQILLGLIGEGTGIAARVMRSIGINLKDARIEIEKIIGRGSGFVAVEIPFTPRAKRILELSLEEARHLEHDYIGTEHLLLGLIREREGVAVRVLENLGAVLSMLRVRVIDILNDTLELSKTPIFENFTRKAIKAILFAEEEASFFGDNFVGPEQILLGLIREETGIAAQVLKSIGVTLEGTRTEVNKLVGKDSQAVPEKLLFTPRAKRALEIASRKARDLGHNYIGTEHLLLGLIDEENNIAVRVLENLHVNLSEMQTRIVDKLEILSLGAKARAIERTNKQTYKCTHCSHEIIAITHPSECEICGSSPLIILN